jgi:hypothetical protein
MRADIATEIIKEHFDIGDCQFKEIFGGLALAIELPYARFDFDKNLIKTPEDLITHFGLKISRVKDGKFYGYGEVMP